MRDLNGIVAALRRPRLLVQAARFGVDDYCRDSQLPRLLGGLAAPSAGPAILRLIALEQEQDDRRMRGAADYAPARHVALLIALLGEARLLRGRAAP